ncbi:hypothetical protein [Methanosarcina sp.]
MGVITSLFRKGLIENRSIFEFENLIPNPISVINRRNGCFKKGKRKNLP